MKTCDAIVIGAGVAGLAAARDLSGADRRCCVIEARDRTGGRILTQHLPDLAVPIELGAEFIHGEAEATFSIVDAAALLTVEIPDEHFWSTRSGRWRRVRDFWGAMERLRAQIKPVASGDRSFAEFLRSKRSLSAQTREMAFGFAEGYNAAHAERLSALSMKASDEETEDPGGYRQFRIAKGYDAIAQWLKAGCDPHRVDFRLGTIATAVKWKKGEVTVSVRPHNSSHQQEIHARALVITIPIGIWKASAGQEGWLRFDPPLEEKQRALSRLEVGHVVKIVFRFRERFWEKRAETFTFAHSPDRFMNTWWTQHPARAPILTGWAGGHAAEALLAEGNEALHGRALQSLASLFRMRRRTLDEMLVRAFSHNWQSDPFCRGAYSYAGVGGRNAHQLLARPVGSTLFFAGEATSGDETGTVAGAIGSGRRAARELLGVKG